MCISLQYDEHLTQLEKDIKAAQEAALEAVETDSILTGTSLNPDDSYTGAIDNCNCNACILADLESKFNWLRYRKIDPYV